MIFFYWQYRCDIWYLTVWLSCHEFLQSAPPWFLISCCISASREPQVGIPLNTLAAVLTSRKKSGHCAERRPEEVSMINQATWLQRWGSQVAHCHVASWRLAFRPIWPLHWDKAQPSTTPFTNWLVDELQREKKVILPLMVCRNQLGFRHTSHPFRYCTQWLLLKSKHFLKCISNPHRQALPKYVSWVLI